MITLQFIPAGSVARAQKSTLYLDVGNTLDVGILDHHQSSAPKASATRLVAENTHLIPKETTTIVLHHAPDLDCVASSFLASYFINNSSLPHYANQLAEYVDLIDFGYSPKHQTSLYYVYALASSEIKDEQERVLLGHRIIEAFATNRFDTGTIPLAYAHYEKSVKEDYALYLEDSARSQKLTVSLPSKKELHKTIQHDGLIIEYPKSKLFKEWARNDSIHATCGFMFLVVRLSQRRVILSVKPDGDVYLKGLGDALNEAEKQRREALGITLDEPIREGYDMQDPWYDGRNPSHNYTIIDAPRRGSELDFEEIVKITEQFYKI